MALLSDRVNRVKPSLTLVISAKAGELKRAGKDIISLGAGEPDFDTPEHIKTAGIQAIQQGQTRYTAVDGTTELKQAIQAKFKRDNGLDYELNEILVSSGGKQSFYNLCQAVLNEGDEVIIPAPYWVSYPDMALLAGGEPVIIETGIEQNFKITAEQLSNAITNKTRMVVINSPSNPTGAIYTADELKSLANVLLQHPNILIASDDMYEHIILGEIQFTNILEVCPELKNRTLVLNGVSKAYSMTGWRIGYAGGPAHYIKAMKTVQSQSTSNPCSISQAASVAALNGTQTCIQTMLTAFKERHDFVVKRINQIPGFKCLPADGAFYMFINVSEAMKMKGFETDADLANAILEQVDVAAVPGSGFGAEGYLRISFATSMTLLENALDRIDNFMRN
ncbi:pyridoxal phosphate-dependent aminotransferase [Thiomicrospira microaerophila]|uniref:pyridoxal phosphate-dependent aminotransferase n=1 Tax=Thiomicrospira microaerophila TaxID=406020 RepID=UPI00200C5C0D|nr:pyridoxal phosphate-dependent aminotransferase [Thiomicrospira microaerophila]UQB42724.1 pyridoxal phosphate-dependent aminotransferase [Thiomicrospira microaerophila]